jgi:hypothetical protein
MARKTPSNFPSFLNPERQQVPLHRDSSAGPTTSLPQTGGVTTYQSPSQNARMLEPMQEEKSKCHRKVANFPSMLSIDLVAKTQNSRERMEETGHKADLAGQETWQEKMKLADAAYRERIRDGMKWNMKEIIRSSMEERMRVTAIHNGSVIHSLMRSVYYLESDRDALDS